MKRKFYKGDIEPWTDLSKLPPPTRNRPFRIWKGRYQKEFYDLQLPSGTIVPNCWPNAGRMNAADGSGRSWRPDGRIKVRLAARDPLADPAPPRSPSDGGETNG